ncbi:hypothetical protein NDU88_009339 [Pleurodeles waltl]|uniref:Uncharacterized protein n=1 Tax=Pleurodeles waltl TaxID=8319 RepID=A0AAV7PS68_PLEWA|nr:hypothetical protein NDU88_009339 [Pleurodeles waltl]
MRHLVFTQGRLCIDFRRLVVDPLGFAGFSDAPGTMSEFPALAGWSYRSCVDSVGIMSNFLLHGRCCIDSSLEVGLHHSSLAVPRSGGLCVKFPVATLALRRSSRCKIALHCSGLACSEFFTAVKAVRRFWQAVRRISPHKESFL